MRDALPAASLDVLFREARSQNGWQPEKIAEAVLHELYDIMKMGPTSANCSPARILFVTSDAAKEKLKAVVSSGNRDKVAAAPVTALIGYDTKFYDMLPELFPHVDARPWFTGSPAFAEQTAFRNSSLQAAYLMIAARSLGLDCGPMSGFDADRLNAAFWPDGQVKVNMICSLGIGDPAKVMDRLPRLAFERACAII